MVRHAARDGINVDKDAPAKARMQLKDEGLRISSRMREGRISDKELNALLAWIDANAERTHIPLGDLVSFALATACVAARSSAFGRGLARPRRPGPQPQAPARSRARRRGAAIAEARGTWPRDDPLEIIKRQPTTSGRIFPYNPDTIGFWFEKACEATGLTGRGIPHASARSTQPLRRGQNMDALRLQLIGGHRDLRHLQRYVKLDAARLANE